MLAGPHSFWRLEGRTCSLALSSCPHSLAHGVFLHLQSQQLNSFPSLFLLLLSHLFLWFGPSGSFSCKDAVMTLDPSEQCRLSPISRSLITPKKSLVPYNITYAHRSWGLRHRYFWGSFSSWPHPLRTKWSQKNQISRQGCAGIHGRESWPWEGGVICHHAS